MVIQSSGDRPIEKRPPILLGVLALVIASLITVYLVLIAQAASFDPDEIAQAHYVWLLSEGLLPHADFGEFHPPLALLYHGILSDFVSSWPNALLFLRLHSAILNLLFIGAIMACAARACNKDQRAWFLLAALISLTIIDNGVVVIQFRPDSVSNTILMVSALLFRLDRQRGFRRSATFAFLAMSALLLTPRFVIFVIALSFLDLLSDRHHGLSLAKQIGAYLLGILLSTVFIAILYALQGLNLFESYWLCIEFHRQVLKNAQGGNALFLKLINERFYSGLCALGFLSFLYCKRLSIKDCEFEWAAMIFIVGQCLLVHVDFRHYAFHLWILGALFIPYLGIMATQLVPRWRSLFFWAALVSALVLLGSKLRTIQSDGGGQSRHLQFLKDLKALKKEGGQVIASPPFRPIDEHDVFYNLFTFRREFEIIMTEKMKSDYRARYTKEYYLQELNKAPPAILTLRGYKELNTSAMELAVKEYFRVHQSDYRRQTVKFGNTGQVSFWVHKDWAAERKH